MPSEPVRVTFLGHSTLLIDMDGLRLITDPILRPRVGPLVRSPGTISAERWAGVDAVLISHSHWDHYDPGSLRRLGAGVTLVVPRGMGADVRRRGFRRVIELVPGQDVELGSNRIEATHAEHRGFGPPVGGTDRAVGYIVHGSRTIYFAGDTAFFEGMADLPRDLDLALVPVWGWGPTARPSEHLDPQGAARAISVIRPRYAIPIHWGTLHPVGMRWMRPATRIDPPHQFAQLAHRSAPGTIVRVLPVEASFEVPAATGGPAAGGPVDVPGDTGG